MSAVAVGKRVDDTGEPLAPLVSGTHRNNLAALIDLKSGAVKSAGDDHGLGEVLGDPDIALLTRAAFGVEMPANLALASKLCADLGGVVSFAVQMEDRDMFLGSVANSRHVLCLTLRHSQPGETATDTLVHARAIRARVVEQAQRQGSLSGSRFSGVQTQTRWAKHLEQGCAKDGFVVAADAFDLAQRRHLASWRRPAAEIGLLADSESAVDAMSQLFDEGLSVVPVVSHYTDVSRLRLNKLQIQIGDRDFYWLRVPAFPESQMPIDDSRVLLWIKPPRPNPSLDWTMIDRVGLNLLRTRIADLLSSGMVTEMTPCPQTTSEVQAIISRLRALPEDDLTHRLDIGGFAPHPVEVEGVSQSCIKCAHYQPHRQSCHLPELQLPVEPHWWCRLHKSGAGGHAR